MTTDGWDWEREEWQAARDRPVTLEHPHTCRCRECARDEAAA